MFVYVQREKSKGIYNEIISRSPLSSGTACIYAILWVGSTYNL